MAAEEKIFPPGLGAPGAMAEYMLVDDERHLVPLGDLDPVKNVSLTDAGLTLNRPGFLAALTLATSPGGVPILDCSRPPRIRLV